MPCPHLQLRPDHYFSNLCRGCGDRFCDSCIDFHAPCHDTGEWTEDTGTGSYGLDFVGEGEGVPPYLSLGPSGSGEMEYEPTVTVTPPPRDETGSTMEEIDWYGLRLQGSGTPVDGGGLDMDQGWLDEEEFGTGFFFNPGAYLDLPLFPDLPVFTPPPTGTGEVGEDLWSEDPQVTTLRLEDFLVDPVSLESVGWEDLFLQPPPPGSEKPPELEEHRVARNETLNTVALPRQWPVRCALWNVANLGGKFGYKYPRDDCVIEAVAAMLHRSGADVIAILEVLERTTAPRAPKPPPKASLSTRQNPFGDERQEGLTADLFQRVGQEIVWDGGDAVAKPPRGKTEFGKELKAAYEEALESYRKLRDALKDEVALLKRRGYYHWLQPYARALAPEEEESDAEAEENAAEREREEIETEAAVEKVQGELMRRYVALVEAVKPEMADDRRCLKCGKGVVVAGVCQNRKCEFNELTTCSNCRGALKKNGECRRCGMRNQRPPDWRPVVTRRLSQIGNSGPQAAYAAAKKKYDEEIQAWRERKKSKHEGLREFLRIKAALNAAAGDAYDSWPASVEAADAVNVYTREETYGVLWRKDRFRPGAEPGFPEDVKFDKRAPLLLPLVLTDGEGTGRKDVAEIFFIPWHAPSADKKRNAEARAQDFAALKKLRDLLVDNQKLAVLLSDLNINTRADENGPIEACEAPSSDPVLGSLATYFHHLTGLSDYLRRTRYGNTGTTVRQSKLSEPVLRPLVEKLWSVNRTGGTDVGARLALEGRFKDLRDLAEYIESFARDSRYEETFSAFDKILALSPLTPAHRLWTVEEAVVPLLKAVAYPNEWGLFQPEPERAVLPSLAFAVHQAGKLKELGELRTDPEPRAPLARVGNYTPRVKRLLRDARRISDHTLLLAQFVVAQANDPMPLPLQVPPPPTPSPPPPQGTDRGAGDEREILDLCAQLVKAVDARDGTADAVRAKLIEKWERYGGFLETGFQSDELKDRDRRMFLVAEVQDALAKEPPAVSPPGTSRDGKGLPDSPVRSKEAAGSRETLVDRLRGGGRYVWTNAGGGDCLFHSLEQLLGMDASMVRFLAVEHLALILSDRAMNEHGGFGEVDRDEMRNRLGLLLDWHQDGWPHVRAYAPPHGTDRWEWYANQMALPGTWGDLIVLAAASHCFGVRFEYYVDLGDRWWSDVVDFSSVPNRPVLELRNTGNFHFEAILEVPQAVVHHQAPVSRVAVERRTAFWSRGEVEQDPTSLYVFGDNAQRTGTGNQAVIRGLPNAFGVRTLWAPGGDLPLLDGTLADNQRMIKEDVDYIANALWSRAFAKLVLPWDGGNQRYNIGTGIAQLDTRSPQTFHYLQAILAALEDWAGKLDFTPPSQTGQTDTGGGTDTGAPQSRKRKDRDDEEEEGAREDGTTSRKRPRDEEPPTDQTQQDEEEGDTQVKRRRLKE